MGNKHLSSFFLSDKPTGLGVYSREILSRSQHFFNQEKFKVMLTRGEIEEQPELQNAVYVNRKVALNPIYRSMYLNMLKTDFHYSFTHHGRSVRRKGKQIITIHDLIPLHYPNQYKSQYYYYKYYLPKIIDSSDLVITISDATKQDILANYKITEDRIKVIHNGYEHTVRIGQSDGSREYETRARPYILMVGTTYAHKNIHTVLKAMKKIEQSNDQFDCVIVGKESEYFNELARLISELKLEDRVSLLGYVNNETLFDLYRHAEVFVYPSLYEGFGLPVLEAMSYNIPTLVSNKSSLPEVCVGASLLFDPDSVNDLSDKLLEIMQNSRIREELIQAGLINLKRFTWDQTSRQIVDEIRQIL